MDRLCLLLVVLLGLTHQVFSQTVQVDNVVVLMLQGSDTYIEADAAHTFVFDVDITLAAGGTGAADAAINKWSLQVDLLDSTMTSIKMVTLDRETTAQRLTPAQADLSIAAGATGKMESVSVTFDLSSVGLTGANMQYLCPDRCPADDNIAMNPVDTRYKLRVTLLPGTKNPPPNYALVDNAGATNPIVNAGTPALTCRGAVLSILPQILSGGLPLKENMVNALVVNVIVTSDANSRSIVSGGADIWDLKFTLENTRTPAVAGDHHVIEFDDVLTVPGGQETSGIADGQSLTFANVPVSFDLASTATDGTGNTDAPRIQTTCVDFDMLCVELLPNAAVAPANPFTFSGSANINKDPDRLPITQNNPKKCITIGNDQCNGLVITDIAVELTGTGPQEFCQGTAPTATVNTLEMSMTVRLAEDSAPLSIAGLGGATDIWRIKAYGSANSDCSGDRVEAATATFKTPFTFTNMQADSDNVFPNIEVEFDLQNYGCQQVRYVCVQLYRNDDTTITDAHFTYEFLRPGVSSADVVSAVADNPTNAETEMSVLNTTPPSSQWGITNVDCVGVQLSGTSLTLDGGSLALGLGEYSTLHRIDFQVVFTESNAAVPDCYVQGDDLWLLEAFIAAPLENVAVTAATATALKYMDVPLVNVQVTPGQEDQDIIANNGMLTFSSARVDFDLSKLDCQEGPFSLCVELKKNPAAMRDFTLETGMYIQCQEIPCVGAQLSQTTITQAQTPSNTPYPLRQGVSDDYLIDVAVASNAASGSIVNPVPGFSTTPNDLWDMDVFLATNNAGGGNVLPVSILDDRCSKFLPDLELQAGGSATFESVRAPLDMTNIQCSEFTHMCVTVKHGATHNQQGSTYINGAGDTIMRAPTIEGIVAGMILDITATCPDPAVALTANNDVEVTCAACTGASEGTSAAGCFCRLPAAPATRPTSVATACMAVTCVGVKITNIECSINVASATGAPANAVVFTNQIREGSEGYFHLDLRIWTDSTAGAVTGYDLWKMRVFLSPDNDGATETVGRDVEATYNALVDNGGWEDTDIDVPGVVKPITVFTPTAAYNPAMPTMGQFKLDYKCEDIRYLCVKLEKNDDAANLPVVGTLPVAVADRDRDFQLDTNPYTSCKVVLPCGGVILDGATLAFVTGSDMSVTEKQIGTENNELTVEVGLMFNAQSAEFTTGMDFWDVDFFLAADAAGSNKIVDASNVVDFNHLNGMVDAGATTTIAGQKPRFDLTGKTCLPQDATHPTPYMYLCMTVRKNTATSPAPSPNFSLSPEHMTRCIMIECQGVKFLEPMIDSVVGGPVLEAEMNNAITVSMKFPIDSNGGHVAANYPADLWRVLIYLTNNLNGVNGPGLPFAQTDAVLTATEIRSSVQSGAPLVFNAKAVSLDYFGKICPASLFICVKLEELPGQNPDCTIDTTLAVKCEPMECNSVKFTSADLMFDDTALCLVEHKAVNEIKFDFNAGTAAGFASVSAPPGADLWKVSAYGSVDPEGGGPIRFGLNQTVFETPLVSGDPFVIDDATLQLNLATFVCPELPLHLCVAVERNDNAVPVFGFDAFSTPNPLRSCKQIQCKGVKMTNIAIVDALNAVTERSGVTNIVTDVQVTTDPKYAGVEGTNLWKITGELRDPDTGTVVLSQPATLSTQQSNQGLVPGTSTTFNDISVAFDLNRNVPCPPSGNFNFCIRFDKGGSRSPDFSIDETSINEKCKLVACKGVCVEASTVSPVGDEAQLKEGISMQMVKLDATFYSDPEYAGIVDQDARNLWKVNVFASPDGTLRLAETPATLDINNANYPLPSGGSLSLSNIMATLDFSTASTYITCSDVKYICVELERDPLSIPTFSLFGCPTTKLIACTPSMCKGVLLERVKLLLGPSAMQPRENTLAFNTGTFDVVLTPNALTSLLPNGPPGNNYWGVEIFGSATDPPNNWSAKTIAIIPATELIKGVTAVGTDTTLSGLTATINLSDTYCGSLAFLCARVYRRSNADPAFKLNGVPDDNALIGCAPVMCEGVDVDSAALTSVDPDCVVEGSSSWAFNYDISFQTNAMGGGVFGSNLWKLRTFLATSIDGTGVIDVNGIAEDAVYPALTGGSQSQTLEPGQPLGFQNVEGTFNTIGFMCPPSPAMVFFCVRLERDDASTSAFTLSSPEADRQECEAIPCKGIQIARDAPTATVPVGAPVFDFTSDRTIITEREANQTFELDIVAATVADTGSIAGTNLWDVEVFFNDMLDGTGNDYSSKVKPVLEPANANRAVVAGANLVLEDVKVDLSAAGLLCGSAAQMYMCVRLSRNVASMPPFSLNPDPLLMCKPITCNPVIITTAECKVNAPPYLLENVNNNLNFEIRLTSANVSASILGSNLWTVNKVYTNNMADGMGTIRIVDETYANPVLDQNQRDRDLQGGNSLIFSDINAFLDLTGRTCADIAAICLEFGKSAAPMPDFTLLFQGTQAPPWCKAIECRGVRAKETILTIKTPSVQERKTGQNILVDVTLNTDAGSAGVTDKDMDLWIITPSYEDSMGNPVASTLLPMVPLGTVDRSVMAGTPLTFANLLLDPAGLDNVVCPEGGLNLCVEISRNPASTTMFTLQEDMPGALKNCTPILCTGVQFTDTTLAVTAGLDIDETNPSATHQINFDFGAVPRPSSTTVSGTSLWTISTFGSRKEDGSGARHLERDLALSPTQADQDLVNLANPLPFNGLSIKLDMRGVRCIDFQYFCAQISRDNKAPNVASVDFSVQGIDLTPATGGPVRDDSVLIACMKMKCLGAFITTFGVSPNPPDAPVVLRENTDDQVFLLNALIESDVLQQPVNGLNLWAIKAFFNPSPDCDAIDAMGNEIRTLETDAVIFGGEDDQPLPAGGSINFNNLKVEVDFQTGTCKDHKPTYLCLEVIRSPQATPPFTLLGNTKKGILAECRGVEVTGTTIVDANWVPTTIIERSAAGQRRKRQEPVPSELTFDLDIRVNTNVGASGISGSDLWKLSVYLSGDQNCASVNTPTLVNAIITSEQANQDTAAGGILLFDVNGIKVPFDGVLCEHARFVCAKIQQGDNPSNEFSLIGVPDESSLVGSYPLDCKGVEIINSQLNIITGTPLVAGDPNHQLVFSFQINTAADGAGVTGKDLFSLFVFGNDQRDGFGKRAGDGYLLPISENVEVVPGVARSFDFRPALLNLQGVSCEEIPYLCVQIFKGAAADPPYTLQPSDPLSPVFTDCIPVPCSGVAIDNLVLDFQSGLPLLEDSPAHRVDFIIRPTASATGASAVGDKLWVADIFINSQADGSGPKVALKPVNIIDNNVNLNKGSTIDLLSNAVLDLTGVVCVNGQFICVDLRKGPEAMPDFTLGGVLRTCKPFTCKGVDFVNPGITLDTRSVLRMLTPNAHIEFNAYVDALPTSASVSGSNLFKVAVFASESQDGSTPPIGKTYANVTGIANVGIVAGARSNLNGLSTYLDLTGVYCNQLNYICIEIWQGDYANPDYQIDSPASQDMLRVCAQAACYGVQIAAVTPSVSLGAPLVENSKDITTWINIELSPSANSASIIGSNLWTATCYANSAPDGSGIRYSVQNAVLQQTELDKDLSYSNLLYSPNPVPVVLQNALVSMDYSSRHCSEIQYVCCTVGENANAAPDFLLEGAFGNNALLTGCTMVPCLGVGVTSTRLTLTDLEILKGDDAHTFSGGVTASIWRQSRAIQVDNTWAMTAYVLDNDKNRVAQGPVELIQAQKDAGVIPGSDLAFQNLNFQMDLSALQCFQIAYVCVELGTQSAVPFTLKGVRDSGEINDEALLGCSPHLKCSDFAVDIQVTDVGERHIEIQWDEGDGDFDTYVITYSPAEPRVESPQYIPRQLRAPLRFDGLTPGQEYTFNLYLYKGGTIKAGPVTEVERTRPDMVDVTIGRQTNSELHVQWTEAEGIYDTYIVELYPQGTPPTPLYVDAQAPRELIFSGLREAREYTVTIYTAVGGRTGYRSLPGFASEITEPAAPFLELDLADPGTTHVDLKWTPPSGYLVGGFKLTSVPLEVGSNLPAELTSDLNKFRVTGLTPGRAYEFQLQAYAEVVANLKIYSDPSKVNARTYPAPVPSADVETATTNSILFTWEEAAGDKDSYKIKFPEQNGPDRVVSALLPRRVTETNLALATHYEFTIITISGGLESAPFKFLASSRPNRPGMIRPDNVDVNLITIKWEPAQGPSDGYEVSYSPSHVEFKPPSPFFTTAAEFTLTGLYPHTTIDFEVRNVVGGAKSDPQVWRQRTFPDLPGKVEELQIEASGPSAVVIRFAQPEYPNGLITAYIVSYEGRKPGVLGVDSGLFTITALPNEYDFEREIGNLRSGYTYKFTVRAANSEGQGESIVYEGLTLYAGLPLLAEKFFGPGFNYFAGVEAGSYTIRNVPVDATAFSDINGEIVGYAVLVVESEAANTTAPVFPPSYNQIKENGVWQVYQTEPIATINELAQQQKTKRQVLSFTYYEVGADKDCPDNPVASYYCNGPLQPLTTYRVAVRAYTEAGYVTTPWSHDITTRADRWWFAYAAIPFMFIVFVLAIILALLACSAGEKKAPRRRKYQDKYYRDDFTDYGAENVCENQNVNMNASGSTIFMLPTSAEPPISGSNRLEKSKLNPTHVLGTRPVTISKFQHHVETLAANNAMKFVEEYENLRPIGDDLARLIGGLPENKDKNRFSNILPYDYNRVQLTEDTYVNASFIGGFNSRHEYIASQGPMSKTVEDFWRMVWENNSPTIVMMGRCVEDGHVKSEQYWPENDETVTYGNLTITMVNEKVDNEWTIRDFTIQSGSEIRAVRQFNFTAWPNHGVPDKTDGVVRFVSTVRAEAPQHSGPMVIHCGAGIGRTGILLALDILMQGLVYDETTVDVYGTVSSLRKQRCCMVQTVHQYIFLHKAMLDILQGKASGYNWLLRTRKGSVGSRDSDQMTSDTL